MKSIFILGASRLQVPAIKKAKERGLYVYVLDYDENAVGIKDADEFLNISTTDSEAVYEAALKYKPDYIITSTSDMPVRTVAWVNEKLGRKNDISYQGALWATDKGLMRDRMKECNVPIPEFRKVTTIEEFHAALEDMPERFVIKPADNAASRGVVLADRQTAELDELFSYAKKYSRSGVVLLE
jgi:phosphoribosylamine-glycine ligase